MRLIVFKLYRGKTPARVPFGGRMYSALCNALGGAVAFRDLDDAVFLKLLAVSILMSSLPVPSCLLPVFTFVERL